MHSRMHQENKMSRNAFPLRIHQSERDRGWRLGDQSPLTPRLIEFHQPLRQWRKPGLSHVFDEYDKIDAETI